MARLIVCGLVLGGAFGLTFHLVGHLVRALVGNLRFCNCGRVLWYGRWNRADCGTCKTTFWRHQ